MSTRAAAIVSGLLSIAGCSSMPELTVGYYLAQVKTGMKITQTAACTKHNIPIVTAASTFVSLYSRRPGSLQTIDLAKLDSAFTKSSMAFDFYEDGRLKSINGTQTGSGSEGVKTLISLLPIVGAMEFSTEDTKEACQTLNNLLTGDQKSLTITHSSQTQFIPDEEPMLEFSQSDVSDDVYEKLVPIFGRVSATYKLLPAQLSFTDRTVYGQSDSKTTSGEKLKLVEPARAKVSIFITRGEKSKVSEKVILVPQLGEPYTLPIQPPPTFGENKIEVSFGEAGNITTLGYTGGGAGPGILTSISGLAKEFEDKTAAEEAATIKAEADLIYQQRRLVECQVSPDDCPK